MRPCQNTIGTLAIFLLGLTRDLVDPGVQALLVVVHHGRHGCLWRSAGSMQPRSARGVPRRRLRALWLAMSAVSCAYDDCSDAQLGAKLPAKRGAA